MLSQEEMKDYNFMESACLQEEQAEDEDTFTTNLESVNYMFQGRKISANYVM